MGGMAASRRAAGRPVRVGLLRAGDERFRIQMAAMAGAAGQRRGGRLHLVHIRNLLDVVRLHVLGHGVHDPGHLLFGLGVVFKLEARAAVGPGVVGVGRVAGVAVHAQRAGPAFHDLVNLLPGQILGQHLQVGGRGIAARRPAAASGGGPCGAWATVATAKTAAVNKAIAAAGGDREVDFQAEISSRVEMASIRWTEF